MDAFDAAFDDIDNWEEQALAEGEELGIEHGRELGVQEGFELGVVKGAEIGSELGFYRGCYVVWARMMASDALKTRIPERAGKSIASLGVLLDEFELRNIVDEDLMSRLLRIRAKVKVVSSLLGLRGALQFNQADVEAHRDMSF